MKTENLVKAFARKGIRVQEGEFKDTYIVNGKHNHVEWYSEGGTAHSLRVTTGRKCKAMTMDCFPPRYIDTIKEAVFSALQG